MNITIIKSVCSFWPLVLYSWPYDSCSVLYQLLDRYRWLCMSIYFCSILILNVQCLYSHIVKAQLAILRWFPYQLFKWPYPGFTWLFLLVCKSLWKIWCLLNTWLVIVCKLLKCYVLCPSVCFSLLGLVVPCVSVFWNQRHLLNQESRHHACRVSQDRELPLYTHALFDTIITSSKFSTQLY